MGKSDWKKLYDLTQLLTGKPTKVDFENLNLKNTENIVMTYGQYVEFLLHLGYNRISEQFFQYLVDGSTEFDLSSRLDLEKYEKGVDRARKFFLLEFGHIRFGYKQFSALSLENIELLKEKVAKYETVDTKIFTSRNKRLIDIENIDGKETYLLGFMVEKDLRERLEKDVEDQEAKELLERREKLMIPGKRNHEAYLSSDYLDVYVATSMRKKHEFLMTHEFIKEVFHSKEMKNLKLRWFDPTQAACEDPIDKGLAEALMLKRADCTLYMAQESDTLGKDSELAVTLAQGKPVIAYVPIGSEEYVDDLIAKFMDMEDLKEDKAILELIEMFNSAAAWKDSDVRSWIKAVENSEEVEMVSMKNYLYKLVRRTYDNRAVKLKNHPLSIQAQLVTGVATGVLVVRNANDCIKLLKSVILEDLSFSIDVREEHTVLIEEISGSVFRVMTNDPLLTNTFWNYYN